MDNSQLNRMAGDVAAINMAVVDKIIGTSDDGFQTLALLLSSMAGTIRTLAAISGRDGVLSRDAITFAATLTACSFAHVGNDIAVDFSVESVLEAVRLFEKTTGKSPDKALNKHLLGSLEKLESDAANAASAMLKAIGIQSGKMN